MTDRRPVNRRCSVTPILTPAAVVPPLGIVEIDKTQHADPPREPREWGPLDEIRG